MKLEKKHYIIIGVVIALIAIWYFFLRKKKAPESNYRMIRKPRRVVGTGNVGVGVGDLGTGFACRTGYTLVGTTCVPNATVGGGVVGAGACPQGFVLNPVTKGCDRVGTMYNY